MLLTLGQWQEQVQRIIGEAHGRTLTDGEKATVWALLPERERRAVREAIECLWDEERSGEPISGDVRRAAQPGQTQAPGTQGAERAT